MKKLSLLLLLGIFTIGSGFSQNWMTNLDVAKSLARVQNKLLFVMWEESTQYDFPVVFRGENGVMYYTDLFQDESVNQAIWTFFVPVILYEATYDDLFSEIENLRSDTYIQRFQDDGIKIMDPNGNILNTGYFDNESFNIARFIKRYSLNTTFLNAQLSNYSSKKSFHTSFALGAKYQDFAVFVNRDVRKEILELAGIYLDESMRLLQKEEIENKIRFRQRFDLLNLKKDLILNKPRRVLRQLKKIDPNTVISQNESLFSFLYYCSYTLLGNESEAASWKSKVSLVDLKKAELIYNINR